MSPSARASRAGGGLGAPAGWAPRARVRPGLERGRGLGLYSGGPSPAPARPPPRLPAPGGHSEQGPSVSPPRAARKERAWSILLSPGDVVEVGAPSGWP